MTLHSNGDQDKEFPVSKFARWLYAITIALVALLDNDSHQEDMKWEPTPLQTEVTFQTIAPLKIIMPLDTTDVCSQARNLTGAIKSTTSIKYLSK